MQQFEPFNLIGKTIKDCHKSSITTGEEELIIEFTDGTRVMIYGTCGDDSLGDTIFSNEVIIQNAP